MAASSRDPKAMAEARSRVADRKKKEVRPEASRSGERDLRATLKRTSSLAPLDEPPEFKRMNLVEMETLETRAECSQSLEASPFSLWRNVVSKSDMAFFQAGVADAQKVSSFLGLSFLLNSGLC